MHSPEDPVDSVSPFDSTTALPKRGFLALDSDFEERHTASAAAARATAPKHLTAVWMSQEQKPKRMKGDKKKVGHHA